ncbi:winged helix-turn-helix transcriptional regulator [Microbispora sitophila]|uniref:winged helix-turn-helix transcriptional regulator n=1 Tax=Microbispora sitophila TaxID=2771537 RepID=UPI001D01578E|nr:helix-turn-helix domain-containing protein [Microbispora sitophila]
MSTTIEHIGEWWTLLILRDAFDGYSRFDQFQENLGISSSRLKTLVADGILERRRYQSNPARHEYVLAELGRSKPGSSPRSAASETSVVLRRCWSTSVVMVVPCVVGSDAVSFADRGRASVTVPRDGVARLGVLGWGFFASNVVRLSCQGCAFA